MNIIFQPYYYWTGHFKQYADSLLGKNDILIKSKKNIIYKGFLSYCILKFYYSMINLIKIRHIIKEKSIKKVFILEFEPLSILLLNRLVFSNKVSYVITIHAIQMNDYKSFFKNKMAQFQRTLLRLALVKMNSSFNCKFIVHTEAHKWQLSSFVSTHDFHINVIDYPAPEPISKIEDYKIELCNPINLLVFGTIRPDKGLFEFIDSVKSCQLNENIKIIVAGKVMDERFINYTPPKGVEIIDRFLEHFELNILVSNCHFFLVPYAKNYTGGAGPAKDATSYGKPVIVSNLDIFKEFSKKDFVYTIDNPNDLTKIIDDLTPLKYELSCSSSLEYSRNNNWTTLRNRYNAL